MMRYLRATYHAVEVDIEVVREECGVFGLNCAVLVKDGCGASCPAAEFGLKRKERERERDARPITQSHLL